MGKSECKASLTLITATDGLFSDGFFRPLAPPHSHRWGGEMELWVVQHRFALSQRLKWIKEGKWDEAKENVRLWRRRFQEDALLKRLIGEFQGDYMLMETKLEEEYLETLRREDKSQDSEPTKNRGSVCVLFAKDALCPGYLCRLGCPHHKASAPMEAIVRRKDSLCQMSGWNPDHRCSLSNASYK